jgi:hypothetical protein
MPDDTLWKQQWMETHDALRIVMQNEIRLMRELLANMHEEELVLLLNDNPGWTQVVQKRVSMLQSLKHLRGQREVTTKNIEGLVFSQGKKQIIGVSDLLPSEEEITCEILSLSDQLVALMEKINYQNTRNEMLFLRTPHNAHLPDPSTPMADPMLQPAKRKSSVATYKRSE